MSAWVYDGENDQHVYYWEGYRAYVAWDAHSSTYVACVWLSDEAIGCRDFDDVISAGVWCGERMWDDWNSSAAMHKELAGV